MLVVGHRSLLPTELFYIVFFVVDVIIVVEIIIIVVVVEITVEVVEALVGAQAGDGGRRRHLDKRAALTHAGFGLIEGNRGSRALSDVGKRTEVRVQIGP
jgi:hypothetical protein